MYSDKFVHVQICSNSRLLVGSQCHPTLQASLNMNEFRRLVRSHLATPSNVLKYPTSSPFPFCIFNKFYLKVLVLCLSSFSYVNILFSAMCKLISRPREEYRFGRLRAEYWAETKGE
jgi:hypothetical protein